MNEFQRTTYLVTMALSVISTAFLIAPVSVHRMLFRRHARRATVQVGHRLAIIGIVLLGLAMVGVTLLIFSVVLGTAAGAIAAVAIGALLIALWAVLPLIVRNRETDPDSPAPHRSRGHRPEGFADHPSTTVDEWGWPTGFDSGEPR